ELRSALDLRLLELEPHQGARSEGPAVPLEEEQSGGEEPRALGGEAEALLVDGAGREGPGGVEDELDPAAPRNSNPQARPRREGGVDGGGPPEGPGGGRGRSVVRTARGSGRVQGERVRCRRRI